MILLDTSVAIPIRDMDPRILGIAERHWRNPQISIITRVELEGGAAEADGHRARLLEAFLASVEVLNFTPAEAEQYRAIVRLAGFSRRKLLDRLIAATALVHDLPLATLNPQDFADVQGLAVLDWG